MSYRLDTPVLRDIEEMIEDGLLFLNDRDEVTGHINVLPGTIETPKQSNERDHVTDLVDVVVIFESYQTTRKAINMAARKTTSKKTTAKKSNSKPKAKAKAEPKAKALSPCLCGCGTMVAKLFAPGHDARVKGWFIRVINDKPKEGEKAAVQKLIKSGKLVSPTFQKLIKQVQQAKTA